jgi:outer membrane protein assembly factor BamB
VLVNGLLVFSVDGADNPRVVALDAGDGSVKWQTPRETPAKKKFSFSTPLVIEEAGRRLVVSPGSGAVCAYDAADGREVWRVLHGEGYSVVPRPVLAHGLLFVGTGYDRPFIHAIRTGGSGDVTGTHLAWTLAKGAPNTPSMVVVDDLLYCVSDAGIASAIEATTGKVAWSERLGGNFSASVLHADGRLYFQNEEGMGYVLKPGRSFEVVSRNDLGERCLASYAVDDGALFIRTKSSLYRIGKRP